MTQSGSETKTDREVQIKPSDISGASIATLVVTLGWNLGTTTWPGKICLWSAPWLVLVLPFIVSTLISVGDDALKHWQWEQQDKRLQKLHDKATTEEDKAAIRAEMHAARLEHITRIRSRMRGADPEPKE
ncbi:hypothetical protein ACFXDP_22575 [Streptomyces sp. NPDC059374]|uniref:hypothetical protein n=1 Tax=Streptomyces sp. NPDC059374 TaxID=3346814 RepID=UPI0036B4D36E